MVIAVMAAVLFLGEDFTWINAMGLMVLVSGVIVFNYFRYQKSLQTDLVTKKSHSLDTVEDGRQVSLLFYHLKVAYRMLRVLGWLLLATVVYLPHASSHCAACMPRSACCCPLCLLALKGGLLPAGKGQMNQLVQQDRDRHELALGDPSPSKALGLSNVVLRGHPET